MKVYNNYDEINHDLRVLKLQNEINEERIKLGIAEIKEDFSPVSLISGVAGSVVKKAFIMKAVAKIVGITKAKIVNR